MTQFLFLFGAPLTGQLGSPFFVPQGKVTGELACDFKDTCIKFLSMIICFTIFFHIFGKKKYKNNNNK